MATYCEMGARFEIGARFEMVSREEIEAIFRALRADGKININQQNDGVFTISIGGVAGFISLKRNEVGLAVEPFTVRKFTREELLKDPCGCVRSIIPF